MIDSRRFGDAPDQLTPEAGRYRLVVSPHCPWCRRVVIAYRLVGLGDALPLTEAVGLGADGFEYRSEGASFDRTIMAATQRELYRRQPGWKPGEPTTIPILLDQADDPRGVIVNHESGDLLVDLVEAWKPLHAAGAPDLLPAAQREQILERVDWLVCNVSQQTQRIVPGGAQRNEAEKTFAAALNWVEQTLTRHAQDAGGDGADAYLFGSAPTIADCTLFTPLQKVVSEHGWGFIAKWPTVDRWVRARMRAEQWMSQAEREEMFGDVNPFDYTVAKDGDEGHDEDAATGDTATGGACSLPPAGNQAEAGACALPWATPSAQS